MCYRLKRNNDQFIVHLNSNLSQQFFIELKTSPKHSKYSAIMDFFIRIY